MLGWFVRRIYRHEQDAVVRAAQFGDAVQEHGRHLLVSVLDESEDLEGKTPRLTLAVLEDRGLGVFTAPAEDNTGGLMVVLQYGERGSRKKQQHPFGMSHFQKLEWIMTLLCGLSSQHLEEGTKCQITERKGHSGVHH